METARDVAEKMRAEGRGIILDQFANPDNPLVALSRHRARRSGASTGGRITHFVSSMGTTGTIMGAGTLLQGKESRQSVIVGCQPEEGSQIPGIRKWPVAYLPKIYDAKARRPRSNRCRRPTPRRLARQLAREEGIFAGISSGGACAVALRIAREVENATIVFIVCDRGDRYLSTGVFPADWPAPYARRPAARAMTPTLVFDIETVPDVAGLRRIARAASDAVRRRRC